MEEKHTPNIIYLVSDSFEGEPCFTWCEDDINDEGNKYIKADMHEELVEALRIIKVDAQDTLRFDLSPTAKLTLQHIEKIATEALNKAKE